MHFFGGFVDIASLSFFKPKGKNYLRFTLIVKNSKTGFLETYCCVGKALLTFGKCFEKEIREKTFYS
jgi:hypothetical protein